MRKFKIRICLLFCAQSAGNQCHTSIFSNIDKMVINLKKKLEVAGFVGARLGCLRLRISLFEERNVALTAAVWTSTNQSLAPDLFDRFGDWWWLSLRTAVRFFFWRSNGVHTTHFNCLAGVVFLCVPIFYIALVRRSDQMLDKWQASLKSLSF